LGVCSQLVGCLYTHHISQDAVWYGIKGTNVADLEEQAFEVIVLLLSYSQESSCAVFSSQTLQGLRTMIKDTYESISAPVAPWYAWNASVAIIKSVVPIISMLDHSKDIP
jgi:hypothetical protein